MPAENSTADKIHANTTTLDFTTKTDALFDPTWQLAIAIEFNFQYLIIAIGVFGTAANALVLYALIEYHLRESKKRAINLLMINQNLLDLTSCVFLIITFSVRLSNTYLTGALGYFLCTILLSENAINCASNASIINLTTASSKTSLFPSRIQLHSDRVRCLRNSQRRENSFNHQPNGNHRRALPEGGPSVLEQEEPEAMDDVRDDRVCVDWRHSVRRSGGLRLDDRG